MRSSCQLTATKCQQVSASINMGQRVSTSSVGVPSIVNKCQHHPSSCQREARMKPR